MRAALAIAAGGALALAGCGSGEPGAQTSSVPTKTASVERTTLTSRESVAGTLGYAGGRPVFDRLAAAAPGTVTAVAPAGSRRPRGPGRHPPRGPTGPPPLRPGPPPPAPGRGG